jgi:hypothetical protein
VSLHQLHQCIVWCYSVSRIKIHWRTFVPDPCFFSVNTTYRSKGHGAPGNLTSFSLSWLPHRGHTCAPFLNETPCRYRGFPTIIVTNQASPELWDNRGIPRLQAQQLTKRRCQGRGIDWKAVLLFSLNRFLHIVSIWGCERGFGQMNSIIINSDFRWQVSVGLLLRRYDEIPACSWISTEGSYGNVARLSAEEGRLETFDEVCPYRQPLRKTFPLNSSTMQFMLLFCQM